MSGPDDQPIAVSRPGVRFGIIDAAIVRDPSLDARAVRAYVVLATYSDTSRECFPTRATLAADMGCSVDTLDRALKPLVKAGILEIKERLGERGEQRSSVYVLHDMQARESTTGGAAPLRLGGPQICGP